MPWPKETIRGWREDKRVRLIGELSDRISWRDESDERLAVELRAKHPEAAPGKWRCKRGWLVDVWWTRTVSRGRRKGKYELWRRIMAVGDERKKLGVEYRWTKFTAPADKFYGYESSGHIGDF